MGNSVGLIRLLLEQSGLGLHCLHTPFYQKVGVQIFQDNYHTEIFAQNMIVPAYVMVSKYSLNNTAYSKHFSKATI